MKQIGIGHKVKNLDRPLPGTYSNQDPHYLN